MKEVLYMAWRYLAYHRFKTAILVISITLIIYLPIALDVLVEQSAAELTARAEATPYLVGAKGSPLELALSSLYFDAAPPDLSTFGEISRIEDTGLAIAIPLYARFRTRDQPIVGTTLEYFDFRHLRLAEGRQMAVLGECVLGAEAAERLGQGSGGSVISAPESLFDVAGVYPLKMRVTGVLERSFTPDDLAVFVDLKTAWVIEGLGHGHQDLESSEAASAVLSREGDRIVANASLLQYNEITEQNIDSFHFHGDLSGNPLTGILVVPKSQKSGVILQGRFESPEIESQIVRPSTVISELLETILTVQAFMMAGVVLVGLATLATSALVFLLSLRLRKREIETLVKIGGSRARVAFVLVSEIVGVLVVSSGLAAILTAVTSRYGSAVIRTMLTRFGA